VIELEKVTINFSKLKDLANEETKEIKPNKIINPDTKEVVYDKKTKVGKFERIETPSLSVEASGATFKNPQKNLGEIELTNPAKGAIFTSTSGKKWMLAIDDQGTIFTVEVI